MLLSICLFKGHVSEGKASISRHRRAFSTFKANRRGATIAISPKWRIRGMALFPLPSRVIQHSHLTDLYKIFRTCISATMLFHFLQLWAAIGTEGLLTFIWGHHCSSQSFLRVSHTVHGCELFCEITFYTSILRDSKVGRVFNPARSEATSLPSKLLAGRKALRRRPCIDHLRLCNCSDILSRNFSPCDIVSSIDSGKRAHFRVQVAVAVHRMINPLSILLHLQVVLDLVKLG